MFSSVLELKVIILNVFTAVVVGDGVGLNNSGTASFDGTGGR